MSMSGWDPCKSSFVPLRIGEVEKALAYTRSILEALGPDERHIKGLDPGIFEAVIVSTNLESLPESYVQICQKLYDELGPYQMESDQKFDSLMDLMEFKLRLLRDEIDERGSIYVVEFPGCFDTEPEKTVRK